MKVFGDEVIDKLKEVLTSKQLSEILKSQTPETIMCSFCETKKFRLKELTVFPSGNFVMLKLLCFGCNNEYILNLTI